MSEKIEPVTDEPLPLDAWLIPHLRRKIEKKIKGKISSEIFMGINCFYLSRMLDRLEYLESERAKMAEQQRELERLRAENGELVELARAAAEHFDDDVDVHPIGHEARAILAKHDAQGEAQAEPDPAPSEPVKPEQRRQ